MAGYKVLGTDHNAFTVSDMARTVRLFSDVLGFEVVREGEAPASMVQVLTGIDAGASFVYLRGPDGHHVELVQYDGPADRGVAKYRQCDTAAAHMAIRVDNVPAAVEAAKQAGLTPANDIITIERPSGVTQSCYMHDPDGLTIEILSRSPPAS